LNRLLGDVCTLDTVVKSPTSWRIIRTRSSAGSIRPLLKTASVESGTLKPSRGKRSWIASNVHSARLSRRIGVLRLGRFFWSTKSRAAVSQIQPIFIAESVFAGHQVREISHSTATNLSATVDAVIHCVNEAQRDHRRIVCFVTEVPGAGKTLAGLSAVHDPILRDGARPAAVFLSRNSPSSKSFGRRWFVI